MINTNTGELTSGKFSISSKSAFTKGLLISFTTAPPPLKPHFHFLSALKNKILSCLSPR